MKKKEITQSPVQSTPVDIPVATPETFDFPAAMREVLAGKQVTKIQWNDPQIVIQLSNNRLQICLPKNDYTPCDWIVADDFTAVDWVVI